MIRRDRALWAVGALACVVCCLSPILAVAGVSTSAVAAAGVWLGRTAALLAGVVGLAVVAVAAVGTRPRRRDPTDRERGGRP